MSSQKMMLKTNPNRKSKFKITVNGTQEKLLKTNKMPFGVLLGLLGGTGGTIGVGHLHDRLAKKDDSETEEEVDNVDIDEDTELYEYEVPTSVEFADNVTDEMSFGEAFKAARQELGQGGFFTWRGQHYNTYTQEEWDSFSEEDKIEFFKMFRENSDFEDGEAYQEEEKVAPEPEEYEHRQDDDQNHKKESENRNEEEVEDVELEEFGSDEEIIEGLNDGEAYSEEDNYGEDL